MTRPDSWNRVTAVILVATLFLLTPTLIPSEAAAVAPVVIGGDDGYVPGELLVGFTAGRPPSEPSRRGLGATLVRTFPGIGVEHWRLPPGLSVGDAVRALSGNPAIRFAEPNYIVHAAFIPFDDFRNHLWGMHNLGQTGGTADADIDALEAWDVRRDATGIVVGIIDTGIDYSHWDLVGNIWTNPGEDLNKNGIVDETDFNSIDDDGNGKIDDLRGWDCRNEDNDPIDDHNHGTHVAGTVGARWNSIGVVGVTWNVKLMPLKFLSASGSGTTADAIECINYAASFVDSSGKRVVRITSNSWGGGRRSRALQDAIAASGALFVAAAGNSGSSSKMYPAGYDLDNIISVAATDHNDALASFSNFGSWVDLGGPGVGIWSTIRNHAWSSFSGTSMATPHVSGAAALVMAQFPAMTNLDVKAQLMNTVDILPSLQGKLVSNGRLNVARAVGGTPDPSDPTPPGEVTDLAVDPSSITSSSVKLNWTATADDDGGITYLYDLRYSTSPITEETWASATKTSSWVRIPNFSGYPEAFTPSGLSGGTTYYFALKVVDEAGNPSPLSNVVSATTAPGGYTVQTVDTLGGCACYKALAYDPLTGYPAAAYSTPDDKVKYARWNGASWDVEVVGSDSPGISLAFSPDGQPSISWGWGKLKFAIKTGSTWTIDVIEAKNAKNDVTSLVYDAAGNPTIAYRTVVGSGDGDLKFARRIGGVWTTEVVDPGAAARYNSLAFDPTTGYPAIAYSDDINDDNSLETLKFARWDGSQWVVEIVETGVVGYGVFVSLAFDPLTGRPAIHHGNGQPSRFLRWNGASWDLELVEAGRMGQLAYDASGAAYIGLQGPDAGRTSIKVTRRDPTTGTWASEVVYPDDEGWIFPMKLDPLGRPSVLFAIMEAGNDIVTYARRNLVWTE